MCCCGKPVKNGEPGYNWTGANDGAGVYPLSAPAVEERDTILFDEPGRCSPQVNGKGQTDYHSYHFRMVDSGHGHYWLLVRHGGGQERFDMGYSFTRLAEVLALLPDSDARYLMLMALYSARRDGDKAGCSRTQDYWHSAASEKRIKTRKMPGRDAVKVQP